MSIPVTTVAASSVAAWLLDLEQIVGRLASVIADQRTAPKKRRLGPVAVDEERWRAEKDAARVLLAARQQCGLMPCRFDKPYARECHKTPTDERGMCAEHAAVLCARCGAPAVRECDSGHYFVCGEPLCGTCKHDTPRTTA